MRWACLVAIFYLDSGLGEVLLCGRLELAFGGNRRKVLPAGQSSPCLTHCMHACVSTETRSLLHGPHHHYHHLLPPAMADPLVVGAGA